MAKLWHCMNCCIEYVFLNQDKWTLFMGCTHIYFPMQKLNKKASFLHKIDIFLNKLGKKEHSYNIPIFNDIRDHSQPKWPFLALAKQDLLYFFLWCKSVFGGSLRSTIPINYCICVGLLITLEFFFWLWTPHRQKVPEKLIDA